MSKVVQQTSATATRGGAHVGLLSQAGLVAGIAALIGASCCALPLALAWLGLAGAWIATLGIFVVYRPHLTAVAVILIGAGWVLALRRQASQRTLVVLGFATVIVGAAVALTHYEPELTRYLVSLRRK